MICPNCGVEIQDDHLICENCGHEVRIVPDYDPATDISIDESVMSDTTNKLTVETYDSLLLDTQTSPLLDIRTVKIRIISIVAIIVGLILVGVGVVFTILHTSNIEYKINKVKAKAAEGQYEAAIIDLENIHVSHPEESQIFFLEADYYVQLGKPELAEDTLRRMIVTTEFSAEEYYQAYDRLIALFASEERYQDIATLLDECPYGDVVTAYQNYLAYAPTFSLDSGEYSDVIKLKLSANTSGTIYYTLDGSVPNEQSSVYGGIITLESGDIHVSAIFVNQYGLRSEVVSRDYSILVTMPKAPEVNYDTGSYDSPKLIEVFAPEGINVYYTTDKTEPTIDSIPYTGPIPMPLNTSNFNFAAINDQGLSSETVVRSYTLSFPNGISVDKAIEILKNRMIEKGMLTDMTGKSDRAPGTYSYLVTSAVTIEGQGEYYIIREKYQDGNGNSLTSETTYLVEIYQGSTGVLGGNANNGFIALAF